MRLRAAAVLALVLSGCTPELPEPESPGARLYAERCNGCHQLQIPSSMTAAMWQIQVDRMQGEMVRRGMAPLSPTDKQVVLDYLTRHAAGAVAP